MLFYSGLFKGNGNCSYTHPAIEKNIALWQQRVIAAAFKIHILSIRFKMPPIIFLLTGLPLSNVYLPPAGN
jgi:hypothetical protein